MSEPRWPAVPEPDLTAGGIYNTVMSLKMSMELITGQRGFDPSYSVDNRFETVTKSLNNLSATVSEQITVAVNENSALAERVTLVEAEIEDARDGEASLDARIVEVDTASVTRDGAIATSLDQTNARLNDVSAGGFFKTTASVTGGTTLASMEAQVYTTTAHTGTLTAGWRTMISGGVSYFDMYSANWRLIDTGGVPKTVMSYSGGQFHFNGNVALDGSLVVTGSLTVLTLADYAVQNQKIYPNAVSSGSTAEGTSNPITVSISARAGATMLLVCFIDGLPDQPTGGGAGQLQVYVNGGLYRNQNVGAMTFVNGMVGSDPPVPTYAVSYFPFTGAYIYIAGYTGTHTIQIYGGGPLAGVYKVLAVTELSK